MDQDHIERKSLEYAFDAGLKFFLHWSLLAGGTLTLMIPFVQSLKGVMVYRYLFIASEICLIISLISSSLVVFGASQISWSNATKAETKGIAKMQGINYKVAIVAYIAGIILAFFFINANLT
ncbi:MAG: hypothetical protein HY433_02420 [Candidatus Liptonbacteria bacterium]|nr:hypothetical protein [Candidatus Liptonbacteria bacterium]